MEKRDFVTKLNVNYKQLSDYVRGRISGIAHVTCNQKSSEVGYSWRIRNSDNTLYFIIRCTAEQYCNFINLIDTLYPDLCIPDYRAVFDSRNETVKTNKPKKERV